MNYVLSLFLSFMLISPQTITKPQPNLREKIGQMLLIGFEGTQIDAQSPIVKAIEAHNIGGVILFDDTRQKNIESPEQIKKLNHDLQRITQESNQKYHRHQLPLLIAVDYEGGRISRLDEKAGFPATLSAAEIGNKGRKTIQNNAQLMASTLKDYGFNLNFAPVLDVNVNQDNPVIAKKERSFSADPDVVTQDAQIYARAFLNNNILCAYKHFPGHGSSTADSHLGFVDVTQTWKKYELSPYKALLNKNKTCAMIMTAHIVNRKLDPSGLPATLSHKMLTQLLRQQLHFKGVIITDDMQMKAISDHYGLEQALTLAINAGADMFIFGNALTEHAQSPQELIDIIEAKVHSGEISAKRIDEAYRRIVRMKKSLTPQRPE